MITRKPPYESTTADPDKTRGQIDKLLRDYGASQVQWNTDYNHNQVHLSFMFETEINGVKKGIAIKIEPPVFVAQRRTWDAKAGRYVKVYAPNWAQSFRLMYYWLKVKIEAVSYGLTSIEQEFLSQVMVKLPSGQSSTIGKELMERGVLTSGEFALEDKEDSRPQVMEARIITEEQTQ